MNKQQLLTAAGLIIVVLAVVGVFLGSSHQTPIIACTTEAKICPDGSSVGRTGPNCEFAACSASGNTSDTKGILSGTMTIGPVCPVERIDHPCTPTPEMFAANKVFVYKNNTTQLVATLTPDAVGHFSGALTPGTYTVDVGHQAVGGARGVPVQVSVSAGKTATVNIDIDTGIR